MRAVNAGRVTAFLLGHSAVNLQMASRKNMPATDDTWRTAHNANSFARRTGLVARWASRQPLRLNHVVSVRTAALYARPSPAPFV